jgi:hypothetical protein
LQFLKLRTDANPLTLIDVFNDGGLATAREDDAVFTLTELGPKEAEMLRMGCNLLARQQASAMLGASTGHSGVEGAPLQRRDDV